MLEDELGHRGVDKAALIDRAVIDSNDYRRKFDNATDNPKLNKALYDVAKILLYDRSGSLYESMYWLDGITGEIITKFVSMGRIPKLTGKDHELKVEYSDGLLKKLRGHTNVTVIHNHPNSTAPSAGDFNSACIHNYTMGFVAAHDGRLFKYASNELINSNIYEKYWREYVEDYFEEVEAQKLAIDKIAQNSDITFEEVYR
ncbi:MAG: hypothetical protein LBM59_00020 [Ruminococcus sp.]|jgi:hypothetical protein|nr:hypothetical protein [Ruminococcus sp.]